MENNNLESTSVEFQYGKQTVKIETNKIARQATAAVVVTIGDLVVLTTVVAKKEADPAKDFFPLAVFYQEKFYATGRIPGGFFKREARPTERETLTSRLIDRPIRPMFPDHFTNEIQEEFTNRISNGEINNWLTSAVPEEYKLVEFNKKPILTNSSICKPKEIDF